MLDASTTASVQRRPAPGAVDVSAIVMSPLYAPSPSPPRGSIGALLQAGNLHHTAPPPTATNDNVIDVIKRLRAMDEALKANAMEVSVSPAERLEPTTLAGAAFTGVAPRPVPPLPSEITVLEREVSRLMRYVELQRDRAEQDREEYVRNADERAQRLIEGMKQECDDLVDVFVKKTEDANLRRHLAEAECARLSEMPALLEHAQGELALRRQQYDEAERGWIGLIKERQAAWEEEKERLIHEVHVARDAATAAELRAAEEVRAARDLQRHWQSREAEEQLRQASLRETGAQTASLVDPTTCDNCAGLHADLTVERERYARIADIATRLQLQLKQTTEAAQEWQDRATQLERELNTRSNDTAASVTDKAEQVQRHYETVVIPDLRTKHRAELDVVVAELEAAHRQITSLLKKNRVLAESLTASSSTVSA